MKSVRFFKLLAISLILMAGTLGCTKGGKGVTPIPGAQVPAPGSRNTGGPVSSDPAISLPRDADTTPSSIPTNPDGSIPQGPRETLGDYDLVREQFKEQTVFFEFDSSTVRPNEKPKLDVVAAFLKTQPTFKVLVEGHCDERGTTEYNRALGERRALAIREVLAALGIPAERVTTLSFGEDKPAVLGSDETAWSKNRRGELVLMKPKT